MSRRSESFEPHYAIEGILVECANRISSIAKCSNDIIGGLVRDLRICARKVQAGSLQLAAIIKEKGGNTTNNIPEEVRDRMEELKKENTDLRKCVEELREQILVIRQTLTTRLRGWKKD